jgi:hypothetical protein
VSATDVLDSIDHAVEDWQVSVDAMRWTPERAKQRQAYPQIIPSPAAVARVALARNAAVAEMVEGVRLAAEQVGRLWGDRLGLVAAAPPASARALDLRRNRHTGPPAPRMDGRRR